jgi:hypothetical protein
MLRRSLLVLGLTAAGLGGIAAVRGVPSASPAALFAIQRAHAASSATDPDANAPCSTDPATGDQIGNCRESQNVGGSGDSVDGVDSP